MTRPEEPPWFVLAVDHRRPHLGALLGLPDEPGPEHAATIGAVKAAVAAGVDAAIGAGADPASAGLLIDEEHGTAPARSAVAAGRLVVMPVEDSGRDRFTLADPGIVDRVAAIGPRGVKALVRYNVDGDPDANRESEAGLRDLAARLPRPGPELMVEVIVPPTPRQLDDAGSAERFARTRRPALAARAIAALFDAGIDPDRWKVEGVDDLDDAAALADAAGRDGRTPRLVVLGAGAPTARVDAWLRVAARTPGWTGFAVGRTLWWDAARELVAGRIGADEVTARVAAAFRHAIEVYTAA
jgi:myo-inositol catabolism protein IolC